MSSDVKDEDERFKYLGIILQKNGSLEENINHMIKYV